MEPCRRWSACGPVGPVLLSSGPPAKTSYSPPCPCLCPSSSLGLCPPAVPLRLQRHLLEALGNLRAAPRLPPLPPLLRTSSAPGSPEHLPPSQAWSPHRAERPGGQDQNLAGRPTGSAVFSLWNPRSAGREDGSCSAAGGPSRLVPAAEPSAPAGPSDPAGPSASAGPSAPAGPSDPAGPSASGPSDIYPGLVFESLFVCRRSLLTLK
uniref:Uncharacterized protein n=1 Tax=Fundulus heteroclitus TaxID=8078 RepID=A0A3Q2Q3M1_FUNHE